MPYLSLNGQRIFYTYKRGAATLPALILIHGAGGSHLSWPAELRRLPDYPLYALDLPGHGRSDPPGCDAIAAYSDQVAQFITRLNLENGVVVGHSMGGAIAQTVALRHPTLVAGLVLIGTGARLPVSDRILEQTLTDLEAAVAFISRHAWAPGAPTPLIEAHRQLMTTIGPTVLHGDFVACDRFNVMTELPQIHVPTLVIAGSLDEMTPITFSQFLADHIPTAELVTIEGGGHMMLLEQPGPVTAAIAVFLRSHFN